MRSLINIMSLITLSILLLASCQTPSIEKEVVTAKKSKKTYLAWAEIQESSKHYISPVQEGFINKIVFNSGDSIKKGTILAYLYHPDYLKIQQEYLKLYNQLTFLRSEFKRQGELTIENISSIKKAEKAESEYYSIEGQVKALEKTLFQIGFNPASIVKKGPIKNAALVSPKNGILIYNNTTEGMLLKPEGHKIYLIINNQITLKTEIPITDYQSINQDDEIIITKNNIEIIKKPINGNLKLIDKKILFETQIENTFPALKNGEILIATLKN